MAVAGMASAQNHAVRTALERPQNEERIQAARAGNSDYLDIGGIFEAVVSSQIRARIRTPVAAKSHDFRCPSFFVRVFHKHFYGM